MYKPFRVSWWNEGVDGGMCRLDPAQKIDMVVWICSGTGMCAFRSQHALLLYYNNYCNGKFVGNRIEEYTSRLQYEWWTGQDGDLGGLYDFLC
jgi:hypothetical protein